MKAIFFGATGMVGQGLLRECLLDPTVEHILSIVQNLKSRVHIPQVNRKYHWAPPSHLLA